jgi:hypothetical protein
MPFGYCALRVLLLFLLRERVGVGTPEMRCGVLPLLLAGEGWVRAREIRLHWALHQSEQRVRWADCSSLSESCAPSSALRCSRARSLLPQAGDGTSRRSPACGRSSGEFPRPAVFAERGMPAAGRDPPCAESSSNQSSARNTNVPLVPPKPKLFDITVCNFASRLSRRIGKSSAFESSRSIFAEPAMKPPCIISRQ